MSEYGRASQLDDSAALKEPKCLYGARECGNWDRRVRISFPRFELRPFARLDVELVAPHPELDADLVATLSEYRAELVGDMEQRPRRVERPEVVGQRGVGVESGILVSQD